MDETVLTSVAMEPLDPGILNDVVSATSDSIEPLDPGILNDVVSTTSVYIESLNPELLNDIVSALQSALSTDILMVGFLVVGSISAFGVFWALRGR
jgi:hypothetical protein